MRRLRSTLLSVTIETYIPERVTCAGRPIDETFAVVLYDADSDTPHGAMTTHAPPAENTRDGPLEVVGTREGRRWRVRIDQIEVVRSTSVGFEFNIFGKVDRQPAE